MTKKHFLAIAERLHAAHKFAGSPVERDGIFRLAQDMASDFEEFNERFDRGAFIRFVLEGA